MRDLFQFSPGWKHVGLWPIAATVAEFIKMLEDRGVFKYEDAEIRAQESQGAVRELFPDDQESIAVVTSKSTTKERANSFASVQYS